MLADPLGDQKHGGGKLFWGFGRPFVTVNKIWFYGSRKKKGKNIYHSKEFGFTVTGKKRGRTFTVVCKMVCLIELRVALPLTFYTKQGA